MVFTGCIGRGSVSGNIVQVSGQAVVTSVSGITVEISGDTVIAKISGQTVSVASGAYVTWSSGLGVTTQFTSGTGVVTSVSGNRVIAETSGQTVSVASGAYVTWSSGLGVTLASGIGVTGVLTSGGGVVTSVSGNYVNAMISGQSLYVEISGQTLFAEISGTVVTTASGDTITAKVSGQTVIAKTSGQTVAVASGTKFIIHDNQDRSAEMNGMGEIRVASHVRLVGASFGADTLDSNFWITATSANATTAVVGNVLSLATAASGNSAAIVMSRRRGRYIGAVPNYCRSLTYLPQPTSGQIARWGAFDSSDGCFWQVDGLNGSSFSTVTRCSTVDTKKTITGFTYNVSNIATTEIYYKNSQALFCIGDTVYGTHTVSNNTWANTLTLPARYEIKNVSGTTNVRSLRSLSCTINRLGEAYTRPNYLYLSSNQLAVLKYGAGTIHSIVINDQGAAGNLLYLKDGTTSGAVTFAQIDTANATEGVWNFEMDFYTGLTALLITGTPAKLTLIYE